MAYDWRPLHQIDPILAETVPAVSVALQKSFARRTAYWVDVYCKPGGKLPDRWFIACQWSFTQKDKTVEGHYVAEGGSARLSAANATEVAMHKLIRQTKKQWLLHSVTIAPPYKNTTIARMMEQAVERAVAAGTKENGQATPEVVIEEKRENPRSRAERWRMKQLARKAKAEW